MFSSEIRDPTLIFLDLLGTCSSIVHFEFFSSFTLIYLNREIHATAYVSFYAYVNITHRSMFSFYLNLGKSHHVREVSVYILSAQRYFSFVISCVFMCVAHHIYTKFNYCGFSLSHRRIGERIISSVSQPAS